MWAMDGDGLSCHIMYTIETGTTDPLPNSELFTRRYEEIAQRTKTESVLTALGTDLPTLTHFAGVSRNCPTSHASHARVTHYFLPHSASGCYSRLELSVFASK